MPVRNVLLGLKKLILITIGLVCLALGILGYILPGLPGTIFLIIAATLFVKSSDRLYNFVIRNKLFGRQVRKFMESGEMSLKAKILSVSSIWVFSGGAVIFGPYGWLFIIPILLLAVAGTIYIASRPTENSHAK